MDGSQTFTGNLTAASSLYDFTVGDTEDSIAAVATAFADQPSDRMDGLTVDMGSEWFNLRPSNTEPVLRLNAEAPDEAAVAELVGRVSRLIDESQSSEEGT